MPVATTTIALSEEVSNGLGTGSNERGNGLDQYSDIVMFGHPDTLIAARLGIGCKVSRMVKRRPASIANQFERGKRSD